MITSAGNAQMKRVAALVKKAKERRAERLFVVEGRKMYEEAPREWISDVYVSESFLKEAEQTGLSLRQPYEVVSDTVFRAISDTKTPQGILCLMRMPHYEPEELIEGERTHLLILESIQDPGNLGTMLRTGEGAGITGVIMNRTTVDLFHPKTIRSTMGSIYRVPFFVTDNLNETVDHLRERGVAIYAAHLRGSVPYDEPCYRGATAFLIGNEGNGLSEETAARADACIRIPMEGKVESLNAAVSASLLMYEVNRQRRGGETR